VKHSMVFFGFSFSRSRRLRAGTLKAPGGGRRACAGTAQPHAQARRGSDIIPLGHAQFPKRFTRQLRCLAGKKEQPELRMR
jgi:hypothetical protein